jgi:hypothetical protein
VKRLGRAFACAWLVLATPAAQAAGICPVLTQLLTAPPAGFIAQRGAAEEPQYWVSKPFLADASCKVWVARSAEAHNIRCVVNDQAAPVKVTAFYETMRADIDTCLAGLPDGAKFKRVAGPVNTDRLKGAETTWVFESDVRRFKIDLADYLRVVLNTSYNSFSVEYMKY